MVDAFVKEHRNGRAIGRDPDIGMAAAGFCCKEIVVLVAVPRAEVDQKQLADAGVPVLEQPLPANHIDAYRKLTKQGALPILIDESVVNIRDLEEFHKLGMCNGASIKPARCAGLLDARRQV